MAEWNGYIRGDARHIPLADECVQCIVTSPPYWGLRDYQQEAQIGLERTPQGYIDSLRDVARELWRVIKPDGTFWLNLGDCYYSGNRGGYRNDSHRWEKSAIQEHVRGNASTVMPNRLPQEGLKDKDLVGIPWRAAFALQADGWYLRSDIIWSKPNPMPESVTDRPTKSHEYVFLLTKSERYYYDHEAIEEVSSYPAGPNAPDRIKSPHGQGFTRRSAHMEGTQRNDGDRWRTVEGGVAPRGTRNKRSVWTISTQPYPEAHYATFPEEIPEICIKAGTKPGDVVLDPFFGSGTVGRVAERLNRRWIGVDLGYHNLQRKRLSNIQRELCI